MKEANHAGRYIPKNHSHSSPAGAESDSNHTAAAPSQTEITDLNCSNHSTTSLRTIFAHFWAGVSHVQVYACLRNAYRLTSHRQGA